MMRSLLSTLLLLLGFYTQVFAQRIPVELIAGHSAVSLDITVSKPLIDSTGWYLFSRSNFTINYHNEEDFGTLNTISYTFGSGIGLAAGGILLHGEGFFPKTGIQFLKNTKTISLFTWFVLTAQHPIDYEYFGMFRFEPHLGGNWKLYTQFELVYQFTFEQHIFSLQRIRLGLGHKNTQFGMGANFTQVGGEEPFRDSNIGVFVRKNF